MSKTKGIVLGQGHVNRVSPSGAIIGNREGYGAKILPKGYEGGSDTVSSQFEGDQMGNRQVEAANGWAQGTLGTRAQTVRGNPDETSITRADYRYGVSPIAGGVDLNNPRANGNGVVFDGVKRSDDYTATPQKSLDSPVMAGAQMPQNDASIKLNEIRNGKGSYWGADEAIEDSVVKVGGVLSK
jgi:hypothetical protein